MKGVGRGTGYLLVVACMALCLVPSSSAQSSVQPNATGFFYPELTYREDQNSDITHFPIGGSEDVKGSISGVASVFADYDNDFRVELVVRDTSSEYLKAFFRRNGTFEPITGQFDKPKSSSPLAVGELEGDGNNKSDILFRNQNGNLGVIDSERSTEFSPDGFVSPVDVGDFDVDGYEEILYVNGNNRLRKFNYISQDPDPSSSSTVSNTDITSSRFGTMVSDADSDGLPEVVFPDGSNGLKAIDDNGNVATISTKVTSFAGSSGRVVAPSDLDRDGSTEYAVARGDQEIVSLDPQESSESLLGIKSGGSDVDLFSYLPANITEASVNGSTFGGGDTVRVSLNVSDGDGYTDIVNGLTKVKFTAPDGTNYTVNAERTGSGVPPDDQKSFEAEFSVPSTGPGGGWDYRAFSRDEKGAGTQRNGDFTVSLNSGEINATLLEPLNNTIVKKDSNFVVNVSIGCVNGDCGTVNATPRYNASSGPPSRVVPNGSGTPFHTQVASEKTCGTLNQGAQCYINWSVNATGQEDTFRLLDVNATSASPSVTSNDTENRLLNIDLAVVIDLRYDVVDFGTLDPGEENKSAQGNSQLLYNMTVFENSVPVDTVEVNASDLQSTSYDYTIPDANLSVSPDNDPDNQTGHKTRLEGGFNDLLGVSSIQPGTNFTHFFFMNVPTGIAKGQYTGEIEFQATT